MFINSLESFPKRQLSLTELVVDGAHVGGVSAQRRHVLGCSAHVDGRLVRIKRVLVVQAIQRIRPIAERLKIVT